MPQAHDALDSLTLHEQGALSLSHAAIQMDAARADQAQLAAALKRNLDVWVAFRSIATHAGGMDQVTRDNLVKLSDFVSASIISDGLRISDSRLETLININLQISEGLLVSGERVN
ncbi:MAG: flagellar biosynthesis regulator FlaF [Magnetospiraceae bacterium]